MTERVGRVPKQPWIQLRLPYPHEIVEVDESRPVQSLALVGIVLSKEEAAALVLKQLELT